MKSENKNLTIDRVFSSPNLSGRTPIALKFSPDGSRVTFLQGKEEDAKQLDLWEYNLGEKQTRLLVNSFSFVSEEESLSDEEKSRRERQRILVKGIVEYYWSENGKALLFPLNGNLYIHDLNLPLEQATRQLTDSPDFETDVRFSPLGNFISFVRKQEIYRIEIHTGHEEQLTHDATETIKNGVAEFVAQEEIDRYTGYWWSTDEKYIAFTQIDESPVKISKRYEINADSFEVFEQRYPYAGTPNVKTKLGVLRLEDGVVHWLDLGENSDFYLLRVNWLPNQKQVAVQRQSRDQKQVDLLFLHVETGESKLISQEQSETWTDVHDNLYFLQKSSRFISSSEKTGFRHLYLYEQDGTVVCPLTEGNWEVADLLNVDEEQGWVYFSASISTPIEKHLFKTSLYNETGVSIQQITQRAGWHQVVVSQNHQFYLDYFSNVETPPQVSIHHIEGEKITFLEENRVDEQHPLFPYLKEFSLPEFGSISASDGQELFYRLTKPASFDPRKKYPALVYVYGGPKAQSILNTWGSPSLQCLANKGYVIFQLDNRGGENRGKAFEKPIHRQLGEAEVEDQKAGVYYLKSLPFVDENRIGVYGHSYGGYMTLLCMMKEPEIFQVGIAIAPVTDWKLYDSHYTEAFLGHPEENPEGYEKSSVFPYVKNTQGPLLIIHGMADDNVLFLNSTKLFKALQDADIPFDVMTYPGSKHSLHEKSVQIHQYKMITRFLETHLKKKER